MKNKNIFTFVLATAVVMFFSACQKEKSSINMSANIVTYGNNGSKVYVDDAHYANWDNGDKVMINGVDYSVVVSGSGSSAIASINGVAVNENGYYAIYPSDRATVSGSGYPSILMPQVQIYEEDAAGNQLINAPMAAYCPSRDNGSHSLDFVNLCSLIEVNVPEGTEVAYINVTSTSNFLWGMATITGEDSPTLSMNDNNTANVYTTSNKTVTLDCTTNGSNGSDNNGGNHAATGVTSAGPFYVVVPARTYTDLTVDVYVFATNANTGRRDVELYTKAVNGTANVASNMIYAVSYSGDPTPIQPPYPYLGTGEFSVSSSKKVRISMGNLQYQASTGMWRFAANQWDIIGNAAGNTTASPNRETQSAWIDLFGYGTSGKTYNNSSYSPCQYQLHAYGPSMNISNKPFDWGVNEISNGGNQPNKWRTLTASEWEYLVNADWPTHTSVRTGKCGMASVTYGGNTYKGLVLVPDTYNGLSFSFQEYKTITETQWETYSDNGCIFLPCAGKRSTLTVTEDYISVTGTNAEEDGYYWSSTWRNGYTASAFRSRIYQNNTGGNVSTIGESTDMGFAVRLVRDVD